MAISVTSVVSPLAGIGLTQAAPPLPPQPEPEEAKPQFPGGPDEAAADRPEQAARPAPEAPDQAEQPIARAEQTQSSDEKAPAESSDRDNSGVRELSPEEKQRVAELKARDQEVRQHERAHLAAAGGLASGGASYEFVTGPDGKRYVVGGEVQIDTSGVPDDPEATITKAQNIRRAALAPAQPSSQDQRVAARATQLEFEARAELAQERTEELREQAAPPELTFSQFGTQLPPQSNPLDQFI